MSKKNVVVLGGGTAGTMAANKLHKALPASEWQITVVDQDDKHDYQPGYLFIPFGVYRPDEVTKSRRKYLSDGIPLVYGEIDRVDTDAQTVALVDGTTLPYDQLIIASGVTPRPDQTPGMDDEGSWRVDVFDFYTREGTTALAKKLGVPVVACEQNPGRLGPRRLGIDGDLGIHSPSAGEERRAGEDDRGKQSVHREEPPMTSL